ncbi:sugar transferase [Leptolyngbya cf. ectocarpi LEGE 11479]|uniref:Sugar transferase n=1 Tax=Leptolyngbya cf. ectocarpi LEGE 11479 TaxID=1828722 RepID=A0A928ZW00_LEPEC|nr:Npun_R2821/Npun_R2822 family protein [Leptolyngbya ectocarpi]MBE9068488.1 sugar transferase [Leptolyngbya cf. ectocarpi LEGE 11479]
MKRGIYTLANDVVYDQLVALLNSIEQNSGHIPVCVIAYNDDIERVTAEVAQRDNVSLLDDATLFKFWEDFSLRVWQTHPTAIKKWKASGVKTQFYRVGENHRYVSFDPAAPFDEFIYLDADTLVLQPLDFMFERLSQADVVVYDFQFKDLSHIFNVNSDKLEIVFSAERLQRDIFCSGCYASKRGLFSEAELDHVVDTLGQGNSDVLYMGAPNQSLLNYMVQINNRSVHNVALEWRPEGKATGNAVSSKHFEERDGLVYDRGKRLSYLHYIGLSSKLFRRVCSGENLDFPYRQTFLHYRYLHEPMPELLGKPRAYNQPPSLQQRLMKKIGLA